MKTYELILWELRIMDRHVVTLTCGSMAEFSKSMESWPPETHQRTFWRDAKEEDVAQYHASPKRRLIHEDEMKLW